MCGIAGYYSKSAGTEHLRKIVTDQISLLKHRGPDGLGTWVDGELGLALGQTRLAVIDLSEGARQPMTSRSGRFVITYNGEIYNYRELRTELLSHGHIFRTESDTEVILEAFERWGVSSTLPRLNGMFAFGVLDAKEKKFYLARDRFGEKPLYYRFSEQGFSFASELKSFTALPSWNPQIDRDALSLFFRFNCIPAPFTIYKDIKKLEPATYICVDLYPYTNNPSNKNYWNYRELLENSNSIRFTAPEDVVLQELDHVIRESVKIRMRSDVPFGSFLSGGIDSSLITAIMQTQSEKKIKTFSIGSDDVMFNEADHAAAVAKHLGTDHTELRVSGKDTLEVIPKLCEIYDEPFSDASQIPTYLVANLAKKYVTVALTGDAGDEVFGGYNRYGWISRFWKKVRFYPRPLRLLLGKILSSIPQYQSNTHQISEKIGRLGSYIQADSDVDVYFRTLSHWQNPSKLVLGANEPSLLHGRREQWPLNLSFAEQMMFVDLSTYVPDDILVKTDRAAMAASLETRVPLLDPNVIEFAARMPLHLKINQGITKYGLKRLLISKYVPSHLVDRPKQGFSIPVGDWLRGPLRPWAETLLDSRKIKQDGLLNHKLIEHAWNMHLRGTNQYQYQLWDVLIFQSWKNRWMPN